MARRGRPPIGTVTPSDFAELLEYWNRAAASDLGIAIKTERPNILVQKLYGARRECGHNGYSELKLVAGDDEVWIVKHG